MDYIISDTHFNHSKILEYENRPFNDVNEMNEFMKDSWNATVNKNDRVYLLGDVMFSHQVTPIIDTLTQLNGKIIIVLGNHDKSLLKYYNKGMFNNPNDKIYIAGQIHEPKVSIYKNQKFEKVVMCHYPLATWNAKHAGRKHFYGHVHSNDIYVENAFNVSADVLNYTPQNFREVIENGK